jgi:hypothetical protein
MTCDSFFFDLFVLLLANARRKTQVDAKGDRSFIDSLVELGWDARANHDRERLIPLLVKVSHPFKTRPKTVVNKHEFDE